jgi:hypothetical protein
MKTFREFVFEDIIDKKYKILKDIRKKIELIDDPKKKEQAMFRADEYEKNIIK